MKLLRMDENGKDKVIKSDIKSVTLVLRNGMRVLIDDEGTLYGGIQVTLERTGVMAIRPRAANAVQIREDTNG
jgi:DNA topoisomerase VI subunit A